MCKMVVLSSKKIVFFFKSIPEINKYYDFYTKKILNVKFTLFTGDVAIRKVGIFMQS